MAREARRPVTIVTPLDEIACLLVGEQERATARITRARDLREGCECKLVDAGRARRGALELEQQREFPKLPLELLLRLDQLLIF